MSNYRALLGVRKKARKAGLIWTRYLPRPLLQWCLGIPSEGDPEHGLQEIHSYVYGEQGEDVGYQYFLVSTRHQRLYAGYTAARWVDSRAGPMARYGEHMDGINGGDGHQDEPKYCYLKAFGCGAANIIVAVAGQNGSVDA